MLPRLEARIESFAPGFRETSLARHVPSPSGLESMDATLVGGDIAGAVIDLRQMLFRPTPPKTLRDFGPRSLSLLVIDPTRWRRTWNMRLSRAPESIRATRKIN